MRGKAAGRQVSDDIRAARRDERRGTVDDGTAGLAPELRVRKRNGWSFRDDPAEALRRLLKPNNTTSLKAAFDVAHKDGMDAFQRGDYDAFGNAIDRERKIIDAIDTTIKHAPKRRKLAQLPRDTSPE